MKSSYLTVGTAVFLMALGSVANAATLEQCVSGKKSAWMNKQKGETLSVTERVEMGSCKKKVFGCSDNWSKKVKSISAKKGYQLKPASISISKTFGANPKKDNYVKELPRKYSELTSIITQKYLKTVSIEVACHRRGSPFKAGCDAAGSISVVQTPLLSNAMLVSFISECSK